MMRKRFALAVLEAMTLHWVGRFGDECPDFRDDCLSILDRIDDERKADECCR